MIRSTVSVFLQAVVGLASTVSAHADIVTDWNATIRQVMQSDGSHVDHKANPGWATRSIAMMNGAIYDAFQSLERTHQPYLFTDRTFNASLEAAVHRAARDILLDCYTHQQERDLIEAAYSDRLTQVANGLEKSNGVAVGAAIAQRYINHRAGDGAAVIAQWPEGTMPGEWRSDPLHNPQIAWGPVWGGVRPWVLEHSGQFAVPGPPPLNSQQYKDAYEMVQNYGAHSTFGSTNTMTSRTEQQTEIGLFWAYDRPTMGPPPVLFVRNLEDIAREVGTSPAENARLFALTSMSMADAMIASWDVKFAANFWRPITGIREGDNDTNPLTVGDPNWVPLGAPGLYALDPNDPNDEDDFTPPFPAYTSGHATMGGAVFKAIELFFGTNSFQAADAKYGSDPLGLTYTLHSDEFGTDTLPGMEHVFDKFTQEGIIDIAMENSPEGENATSRIYLGIHWIFDQRDGTYLGNDIAAYVFANQFYAVPEPASAILMSAPIVVLIGMRRRPTQSPRTKWIA